MHGEAIETKQKPSNISPATRKLEKQWQIVKLEWEMCNQMLSRNDEEKSQHDVDGSRQAKGRMVKHQIALHESICSENY